MSTGIVAAIVMAWRNGIDKDTLVDKYSWLETEIQARGGRVDPLSRTMSPSAIVNRALQLLGRHVVQERRSFVEPLIDGRESYRSFLQLGLYRNQVPHIFFPEAVCLVVLASVKDKSLSMVELLERAEFVKNLLSVEFHTAADVSNTQDWADTVLKMQRRGLVNVVEEAGGGGRVTVSQDDPNKAAFFYCTLLWPFIDAHWVALLSLYTLLPQRKVGEELLISQMQWFAEKLFFDGVIIHFDACSKESMRYAVQALKQRFGVVRQVEGGGKFQLTDEYSDEARLRLLCDQVGEYRRGNSKVSGKDYVLSRFPLLAKL